MIRICEKCGKREHKRKTISPYCNQCRVYLFNLERRKRLIKEQKCIRCGGEVKPKIVYRRRCGECLKKLRKSG